MPRWLRHFLTRRSVDQHFLICVCAGMLLRALCAIFVYGPQALDDYKHGVWPAYQFFAGLPLDLPDYRSHLLIWCLAGFVRVGAWFGVESALAQVRVMYLGLGFLSLLGLVGTWQFVRSSRSKLFAGLALYLVALFPLMPFLSTRAFGEAVATSFVLLGFGVLENSRRHGAQSLGPWCAGFLALGVAVLFRFHVGLLYISYLAVLLVLRNSRALIVGALTAVGLIAAQFLIDYVSGKEAFGTLISYLVENEGGAAKYGVSPWYNTWLFVLVLTLPPFSLVFYRKLPGLWRRHWPWLAPFLVFVMAHSLVAHKEERFMYPIVGLELWALAWVWAASAFLRPARRIYSVAFFALCTPILFIICLVNSQEGEIEPPAYVESRYRDVAYLDYQSLFGESRFQFYFLRPPSILRAVGKGSFNATEIDRAIQNHRAVALLTSEPDMRDELHALEGMKTEATVCHSLRSAGSLIDRLLYALNPKHNQRRRPTWYLVCERG